MSISKVYFTWTLSHPQELLVEWKIRNFRKKTKRKYAARNNEHNEGIEIFFKWKPLIRKQKYSNSISIKGFSFKSKVKGKKKIDSCYW